MSTNDSVEFFRWLQELPDVEVVSFAGDYCEHAFFHASQDVSSFYIMYLHQKRLDLRTKELCSIGQAHTQAPRRLAIEAKHMI